MSLKILHTGDIHIGMKFNNYPAQIKEDLVKVRFEVLESLINKANEEKCNIFVVTGDLFDKINIPKKDVIRAINILDGFAGDCVLVLPGNHDYDNGMVDLWENFSQNLTGKMLLLTEHQPYCLKDFDLDVTVYPAHCHSKHSDQNNLGWIKKLSERDDSKWQIGIAHGALIDISPDIAGKYFNMSERELIDIEMDLWLLGHTHLPYPEQKEVSNRKVFNAGTPEPDGMDCRHGGNAWLLTLEDKGKVKAEALETGNYRFYDLEQVIHSESDLEKLKESLLTDQPGRKLVRTTLMGRIDEEIYNKRNELYRELKDKLAYFNVDDSQLRIKINKDVIEKEFTRNSFPYKLLNELSSSGDEEALQVVYGLIKGVKNEAE